MCNERGEADRWVGETGGPIKCCDEINKWIRANHCGAKRVRPTRQMQLKALYARWMESSRVESVEYSKSLKAAAAAAAATK